MKKLLLFVFVLAAFPSQLLSASRGDYGYLCATYGLFFRDTSSCYVIVTEVIGDSLRVELLEQCYFGGNDTSSRGSNRIVDSYALFTDKHCRVGVDQAANERKEREKAQKELPKAIKKTLKSMKFIRVPAGTFEMGCGSWQSDCNDEEKPPHTVKIGSFEIGKHEVTQGQWKAVMGANPSNFSSCGDNCPVEQVSWDEVQEFVQRLNAHEQRTYRLPTEAEWEYACRSGGKPEKYCGGNDIDRLAWYSGNSGSKTHPVGQKAANGLGIYDMSGNVYEWTCSDYGKYDDGGKNHAKCSSGGSYRVFRGGGWISNPAIVRSADRGSGDPGNRYFILGLRLARTSP